MYDMTTYTVDNEGIFWIFNGPWQLLDNFAALTVVVDVGFGVERYKTAEHAYAAGKATCTVDHDYVWEAPNPGAAKARGQTIDLRPDWEERRWVIMKRVLRAKYFQNARFRVKLRQTGDRLIVEGNVCDDQVWGATPPEGQARLGDNPAAVFKPGTVLTGRNGLGNMLVELRQENQG